MIEKQLKFKSKNNKQKLQKSYNINDKKIRSPTINNKFIIIMVNLYNFLTLILEVYIN